MDIPHIVLVGVADLVHLLGSTLDFSVVELTDNRSSRSHQHLVFCGAHGQDPPPFTANVVLKPVPVRESTLGHMAVVDRAEHITDGFVSAFLLVHFALHVG